MPLDTFICGCCMGTFNDIEQFLLHKKQCEAKAEEGVVIQSQDAVTSADEASHTINAITQLNTSGVPVSLEVTNDDGTVVTNQEAFLSNALLQSESRPDQPQTLIILQGELPTLKVEGATVAGASPTPGSAKRRGRPRRGEEKTPRSAAVKEEKVAMDITNYPERSKDGKFLCTRCKRSFTKERFFKTHKCLATSGYVDMSNREVRLEESGDEETTAPEFVDTGALDMDVADADYTAPQIDDDLRDQSASKANINNVEVQADPDVDSSQPEKATDVIEDIPIFKSDEERQAFEQSMNVDLSVVDEMFRVHMIIQDLNENAKSGSRMNNNSLSLFSCNVCDKVFKTLSHMRLHCIIHTNLKPFKCSKCNFASNCRGNLYTHMRKHTGQFYKCKQCDFKTVNKSHLLEHEATHSSQRHPCELCKKDYNTHKSLINHIRKYHTSAKGKEYLQTFLQGREARGSTVIHQCHVCNRKFKKKIDRDRHLFVHDIRDIPNIQNCELCDYSASRRVYLEKHFQKHRCIYRCCKCDEKFLSSLRLIEHLTNAHIKLDKWETMFEESINNSVYLPEPDESLLGTEKELVNLPPELSESTLNMEKQLANQRVQAVVEEMNSGDQFINKVDLGVGSGSDAVPIEGEPGSSADTAVPARLDETVKEEPVSDSEMDVDQENRTEHQNIDGSDEKMEEESMETGNSVSHETSSDLNGNPSTGVSEDTVKNLVNSLDAGMHALEDKGSDLIKRLGYLPMTMEIFQKMRETFGNEECEFCGRLFFSKVDYEPHVRTHTGDKPHVCSRCGYRAITKDNLKRHIDKEHNKITFGCSDCHYIALSRTQLWNHQMKHRGLKGLECPECQEQFESIKELRSHALIKHPDSNRDEINKITGYKHKMQGKMGRRSYKCPHCDKVFFRAQAELQKHIWIHEGIKPFKCPLCPHACRSKNNLQAHMLRHSKDKPFLCTDCGKSYKSKTALRWHVRAHNDGKIFKCDKCPYEGSQSSHLKRHMETHDIQKRFMCAHCDFSANTIGYLKIHYTRYHKGVGWTDIHPVNTQEHIQKKVEGNSYKCLSCDYLFGNMTDLKRHLKIRHHVQVQDIQSLDSASSVSEVQVLHYEEPPNEEEITQEASAVLQSQPAADGSNLDEKTASAVNIIQRIIGMSHQGTFTPQQQVVDGQMEIIVQQDVEEVLVANGEEGLDSGQYVIQYVTPQEANVNVDELSLIEVQTEGEPGEVTISQEAEVLQVSHDNQVVLPEQQEPHDQQVLLQQGSENQELPVPEQHMLHVSQDEHSLHVGQVIQEEGSNH